MQALPFYDPDTTLGPFRYDGQPADEQPPRPLPSNARVREGRAAGAFGSTGGDFALVRRLE